MAGEPPDPRGGAEPVPCYCIAEIEITDPAWVSDYVREVTRMVEARGGRYLARTSRVERLEGDRAPPAVLLLIEWPSWEAAEEFHAREEYRPYGRLRRAGARTEMMLVAGVDDTGAARPRKSPKPL